MLVEQLARLARSVPDAGARRRTRAPALQWLCLTRLQVCAADSHAAGHHALAGRQRAVE